MPTSFYYLASRILICIGQLLIIRVMTSVLNPIEIGRFYILMSFVSIILLFLINPISMYISRHFYGWYRDGIGWLVMKKLAVFLVVISMAVTAVMLVLRNFHLLQNQLLYGNLYLFIPFLIVGTTISSYPQELLNIVGQSRAFFLLSNIELWGKIGAIYVFALFFPPIAMTVIGAITLWSLVFSFLSGSVLYIYIKDVRSKKFSSNFKGIREIFNFAWPFSIATGLYWCQSDGYRFILQHVSGVEAVGKFVVGFNLGATLMIALDIFFHQLYLPTYYKEISVETVESHTEAWNKYAQKVVGVFIPFGLYIACAGPYLSHWLLHSTYWNVGVYAAFGAISQLFRIFSGSLNNGIIAQKQTRTMILPNLIGAVVVLGGTLLFTERNPMVGTGIVLLLSYVAVSVGLYLKLSNKMRIRLPISDIFKSIKLITPVCIILLVSINFGFAAVPLFNIFILLVTGLILIYTQWILSRDIWFVSR